MGSTERDEPSATAPTVLIVEDEPLIGLDLAMQLEDWGYRPDGPHMSADAALEAVASAPPDLAVLDVNLGDGLTTFGVAAELRRLGVPFAFVTGYSKETYGDEALFAQAPCLNKPFDPIALRSLLRRMGERPPAG